MGANISRLHNSCSGAEWLKSKGSLAIRGLPVHTLPCYYYSTQTRLLLYSKDKKGRCRILITAIDTVSVNMAGLWFPPGSAVIRALVTSTARERRGYYTPIILPVAPTTWFGRELRFHECNSESIKHFAKRLLYSAACLPAWLSKDDVSSIQIYSEYWP